MHQWGKGLHGRERCRPVLLLVDKKSEDNGSQEHQSAYMQNRPKKGTVHLDLLAILET